MTDHGAGAWLRVPYYSKDTVGKTIPAKYVLNDRDLVRIRSAFRAVEAELKIQGCFPDSITEFTGVCGPIADAAIKKFQRKVGLTADGAAGRLTLRQLIWPVIKWEQAFARVRIPDNLLYGLLFHESELDPGAEGYERENGTDMSLAQLNDRANPGLTPAMVYGNMRLNVKIAATRLVEGRRRQADDLSYADRGQWDLAIADHNSPASADSWFDSGQPPSVRIAEYVEKIREKARLAPAT